MDNEVRNFIMFLVSVLTALSYCYFISSKIREGMLRLLSLLPIISIFILLPLLLKPFVLQLTFGFFIGWLANFKLLLFAFGKEPLSLSTNDKNSLPFLHFIFIATLPIKIKQDSKTMGDKHNKHLTSFLDFSLITLLWFLLIHSQDYKDLIHPDPMVTRALYIFRMNYGIQLIFAVFAALARLVLRHELEPQFEKPHLSTSLQDFWGRRWNLMNAIALKKTIHEPIKSLLTPILGKKWSLFWAILSTFTVSGLMHELLYFYVRRIWPTWEVMWFFVIHGGCLAIEIELKRGLKGRGSMHPVVSWCLAMGFILSTSFWLLYSELLECGADVREIREYMALVEYVRSTLSVLQIS